MQMVKRVMNKDADVENNAVDRGLKSALKLSRKAVASLILTAVWLAAYILQYHFNFYVHSQRVNYHFHDVLSFMVLLIPLAAIVAGILAKREIRKGRSRGKLPANIALALGILSLLFTGLLHYAIWSFLSDSSFK